MASPFVLVREPLELPRRLQWSALDVSLRFLACGTRTGSVFLFRRRGGTADAPLALTLLETVSTGFGADKTTTALGKLSKSKKTLLGKSNAVLRLKFSPDERMLVVASGGGELCVVELNLESARRKPRVVQRHTLPDAAHVTALCWDRAAARLFVGTSGGVVAYMEATSERQRSGSGVSGGGNGSEGGGKGGGGGGSSGKGAIRGLSKIQSLLAAASSAAPKLKVLCRLESQVVQMELAPERNARELLASTMERCVYLSLDGVTNRGGIGSGNGIASGSDSGIGGSRTSIDPPSGGNDAAETRPGGKPEEGAAATRRATIIDEPRSAQDASPKQIGKKKRKGAFGVCYCTATDPAARVALDQLAKQAAENAANAPGENASGNVATLPAGRPSLLYAARPGRRVWLANARDQSVMCTLSLKKKMPARPSVFWGNAQPIKRPQTTVSSAPAKLEFAQLAAFRTNAGGKAPSSDILLSWSTSGNLFFINTNISDPAAVRVLHWHNDLGEIVDLVVCGRMCIEASSALFALHGGDARAESPLLSRIIALHPLSFLESYLADTVPVMDCIRLALEHKVMSLEPLERLESRLRGGGLRRRGSEEEEEADAKAVSTFVELLDGLRAEVRAREPDLPVSAKDEKHPERKDATMVTAQPPESGPKVIPKALVEPTSSDLMPESSDTASQVNAKTTASSQQSPLSITSVADIQKQVTKTWVADTVDNFNARRRYRVLAVALSQQVQGMVLPEEIPSDVISRGDLGTWFAQLNDYVNDFARKARAADAAQRSTSSRLGQGARAGTDTESDASPHLSPMLSPNIRPTWGSATAMVPIQMPGAAVGAAYTTTTPSSYAESSSAVRRKDRKKKRKKRRERIASVADLESTSVDVTGYHKDLAAQQQLQNAKQKRVSNLAKGALTRAVGAASNAKIAAIKALDTMNKSNSNVGTKSLPVIRAASSEQGGGGVGDGSAGSKSSQDSSVSVTAAIQRLHKNQSAMPWVKLRTAGIPGSPMAIAAAKEAGDVAADPTLKNLDKWLKKKQQEERLRSLTSTSSSEDAGHRQPFEHRQYHDVTVTDDMLNLDGADTGVDGEGVGSVVGGAMDYLVRNVGGSVVETMAGIASGVSSAATSMGTSDWPESDASGPLDLGIPAGEQLRGRRSAIVEYTSTERYNAAVSGGNDEEKTAKPGATALSMHVSVHTPILGVHIPSTLNLMRESFGFEMPEARGSATSEIVTMRAEQMCYDSTNEDKLLGFIKLHKDTVDIERCLLAVSRRVPSSGALLYSVLQLLVGGHGDPSAQTLEELRNAIDKNAASGTPVPLAVLLCPGTLVHMYASCTDENYDDEEESDDQKFVLDTAVALCEFVGIQILVYLALPKALLTASACNATLDTLPWKNPEWLSLVLAHVAPAKQGLAQSFFRKVLCRIFAGGEGLGYIPRMQRRNPGTALKLLCRRTTALVHAWVFLEVEAELKSRSINEVAFKTVEGDSDNTSKMAELTNVDALLSSMMRRAHPFASRYAMEHSWVAQQLERVGYMPGLMTLLEIAKLKHQSLSIQYGTMTGGARTGETDQNAGTQSELKRSLESSESSILQVATCSANVAVVGAFLERLSDVFENSATVMSVDPLVSLLTRTLSGNGTGAEESTQNNKSRVDLKKALLRGILCGAGAERAVQVMDAAGSSFWEDLPFEVFETLVSHERRRKRRQSCTGDLAVSLDKYLWSRKPEALPPQLRALRLCERSLKQSPELKPKIMDRVPARAHVLFAEQEGASKLNHTADRSQRGTSRGLPTFHADEGGQWGTVVPVIPLSEQRGLDPQLDNYLPCEASGLFMESGRMVTVFPCGHVVLAERSTYGACPCCPISSSELQEAV